jgi:hypothetical protein
MDYREARYKNVCKDLRGDVWLYFAFIESKYTAPWTGYDIQSTIDPIRASITWLHSKAGSNNIPLNIKADLYKGSEFTTITRNLPEPTVRESVTNPTIKKGKAIDKLDLSDYTKYLIGRIDELDPEPETLMTDNILNF